MKKKINILIIFLLIISGCMFIRKQEQITDTNTTTTTNNEKSQFRIETIDNNLPCWINKPPHECTKYQNMNDIFITCAIDTEKQSEEPTMAQINSVNNKLSSRYFKLLTDSVKDDLFSRYSECKKNMVVCKKIINDYIAQQEIFIKEFEFNDKYWLNKNDLWELNILACVLNDDFIRHKKYIIEKKILPNFPELKIHNNPKIKWIP